MKETQSGRFEKILRQRNLRTLFQPIVSFRGSEPKTYAIEALTRGPEGSDFESPEKLFNTAVRKDDLYRLERITRELSIKRFAELKTENLFINVDPNIIYDDSFAPGNTLAYLQDMNVSQDQVVFEITERNRIKNREAFEEALRHYRDQGFKIAVDDVGAGYANLDKIAQLKPEYIKLDMSLIRNLHRNRSYSQLVETIIDFADRIGSKIIGEGIEKQEELQILLSMGMDYGQGFFLARPTPHGSELNNEITSVQKRHSKIEKKSADKPSVRSLIHKVQTVAPDAPSKEIYRHFDENSQEKSVVLTDNKQPVGLVMRHTLHEKLSGNMGQSLYWKRPVRKIADEEPLIVSEKANVHQVSQIITENDSRNIDQDVIVVEDDTGRYLGNLSIKTLLEKITNLKTQKARRANPLTGLPGNIEIRDRIRRNLNHDRTFTLIYVDLDHFKPFNDYYGFERGDEAILSLKNLLSDGMEVYPSPMNFLGHIGGDDFVAITSTQHVQDYCEYVIDQFDDRIRELYDPDDLQDGFIKTKNRQRESQKFNIMTVSLAVVTNQDRSFENHLEMSEVAAEMKQYVKQNREKSSYAIDRRQSG